MAILFAEAPGLDLPSLGDTAAVVIEELGKLTAQQADRLYARSPNEPADLAAFAADLACLGRLIAWTGEHLRALAVAAPEPPPASEATPPAA